MLCGMIEQMFLSLNNFASHGSGWTVDLPTELARSQYLLHIRNRPDENFFLYCYTAQYQKQNWTQIDTRQCLLETKKQIQECMVQKIAEQSNHFVNS